MIHRLSSLDIYCDNCHRSFGEDVSEPATAVGNSFTSNIRTARRELLTYDWKRRGGKDLCPKCAALSDQHGPKSEGSAK